MVELQLIRQGYKAVLEPTNDSRGRLSVFYNHNETKDNLVTKILCNNKKDKTKLTLEHSFSVLQSAFTGEFTNLRYSPRAYSRAIIEQYLSVTGREKLPQNLAFIFLCEYPKFSENQNNNPSFVPFSKRDLERLIVGREGPSDKEFPRVYNVISRGEEEKLFQSLDFYKAILHSSARGILNPSQERNSPFRKEMTSMTKAYNNMSLLVEGIVKANLLLVPFIASSLEFNSLPKEELLETGLLTLFRAAKNFDINKGYKFCTFAGNEIRLTLRTYKGKETRKRLPKPLEEYYERDKSIGKAREEELAVQCELIRDIIDRNLAHLKEREVEVIKLRFGLNGSTNGKGSTPEHIGEKIEVTGERVRQIQNRALRKIREAFNREYSCRYEVAKI
ncbi:sigma-70 family RNA polymerase sigma factor [Candidatus Pacearchaeota archaeon]|nr:sigma-70 family RNA polymerase sigma factor [Candidatus Pacearchaeota archaeon]